MVNVQGVLKNSTSFVFVVQVYLCHDNDTGRELAVKVVDIDHIDHAAPSNDSFQMQRVSFDPIVIVLSQ